MIRRRNQDLSPAQRERDSGFIRHALRPARPVRAERSTPLLPAPMARLTLPQTITAAQANSGFALQRTHRRVSISLRIYPHPLASGTPTANAPTFSPSTGTPPQTVTMSCSTGGSIGCYTTNGSTPTAATAGTCDGSPTNTYSSPISVSVNPTTLNGICTAVGFLNSPQASSTYAGTSVCGDPTQNGPNFSGDFYRPTHDTSPVDRFHVSHRRLLNVYDVGRLDTDLRKHRLRRPEHLLNHDHARHCLSRRIHKFLCHRRNMDHHWWWWCTPTASIHHPDWTVGDL